MMRKLLQRLYGLIIDRRNRQFNDRTRPVVRVTVPVISVGNVSAGGTGKSPAVQMIVRMLQNHGYRPAIVLRGYRRRSRGLLVVHGGAHMLASVDSAGDEAYMHATTLGVPVVVSNDKVEAAAHAAGCLPCDVIVVDDGFQHRALHRSTDIVLVDEATLHGSLLPVGRLREPLASLRRATIVLCSDEKLIDKTRSFCEHSTIVTHTTVVLQCDVPTSKSVIMVSGIAHPDRMRRALEQAGYTIAERLAYPDHHRYRTRDLWNIRDAALRHNAVVVTTEKDIAKIQMAHTSNELQNIDIHVARIQMAIAGPEVMGRILQDIENENRTNQE